MANRLQGVGKPGRELRFSLSPALALAHCVYYRYLCRVLSLSLRLARRRRWYNGVAAPFTLPGECECGVRACKRSLARDLAPERRKFTKVGFYSPQQCAGVFPGSQILSHVLRLDLLYLWVNWRGEFFGFLEQFAF